MREQLLQLTGVTRRFPAGVKDVIALKNINLSIDAGEIVAIIGSSGSGKSTLMNILGCLDYPSSGSYKVAGRETGELAVDELARLRREHFGFIFQRYHLLPHLTAVANVEMPAVYEGSSHAERRERAIWLLTRLGLADRAEYRPSQLSGGQQQRVSIARALMNGADVILADEPTGALDTRSGEEMIGILRELNAFGHTVIIVTHDEHVAKHAQRVIEIRDGEIVRDRTNPCGVEGQALFGSGSNPMPRHVRRLSAGLGRLTEAVKIAWLALVSHRMRTLLTMLGIIIGTTSVVSIVAIGEGAKRYLLDEIGSMGANTINIFPGRDWGDSQAETIQTLVPSDVEALGEQHHVDSASPETARNLLLRYRNINVSARVSGVSESFFRVRGLKMAQGIGFGLDEVRRQSQVVVIDQNTRRKLFGSNPSPLGQVILIDNLPCVVIGVTMEKKSTFSDSKNLSVWVPYTTASGRLFGQHYLDSITVRVRDGQLSKAAEHSLTNLMMQRHGRKDFFTDNMDSVVKTVQKTGQSLTLLLSLIAVISLVVGGIGVMNIMLVSVTERTREIGIRMATGARQTDIMQQFLVEAVMVCVMSGAIGIVLSFGMSFLFSLFVEPWKMVFSVGSIVFAFLYSTLIGIVFGFVPSRNASRLNPVDALARD